MPKRVVVLSQGNEFNTEKEDQVQNSVNLYNDVNIIQSDKERTKLRPLLIQGYY
jgi:hypothetical protein